MKRQMYADQRRATFHERRTTRSAPLARTIHECRRETFETEARRGFSHVRSTQAYLQSVEKAEREPLAGRENRATEQGFMNGPG